MSPLHHGSLLDYRVAAMGHANRPQGMQSLHLQTPSMSLSLSRCDISALEQRLHTVQGKHIAATQALEEAAAAIPAELLRLKVVARICKFA